MAHVDSRVIYIRAPMSVGRSFPRRLFLQDTTINFVNIVKMALIRSQPPELFARDIVRYSDVELDQYLEANGRSGVSEPHDLRVAKVHVDWLKWKTRRTCPKILSRD